MISSMKNINTLFFSQHAAGAVIIALATLILSYLCAYSWHTNGFTIMEVSLLAVLPSLITFFIFFISSIIFINKYRRDEISDGNTPINKWISVLFLLILSTLILFGMDWLFFLFIDSSIPNDFAGGLKEVAYSGGQSVDDLENFHKLPFTIQNSFTIVGCALISGLLSIIFIKKDGIVVKPKIDTL